jgi:hypothetical protein
MNTMQIQLIDIIINTTTIITAVGIRRADDVTHFYPQKLSLTSPTTDGCSAGIVRSRTKATLLLLLIQLQVITVNTNLSVLYTRE